MMLGPYNIGNGVFVRAAKYSGMVEEKVMNGEGGVPSCCFAVDPFAPAANGTGVTQSREPASFEHKLKHELRIASYRTVRQSISIVGYTKVYTSERLYPHIVKRGTVIMHNQTCSVAFVVQGSVGAKSISSFQAGVSDICDRSVCTLIEICHDRLLVRQHYKSVILDYSPAEEEVRWPDA
jgi:hypothetical protein